MDFSTVFIVGAIAVGVGLLLRQLTQAWLPQTFSAAARLTFGAVTAAGLFVGAGLAGYRLSRHDRFVTGTSWAGEIIWWQVAVGALFSVLALYSLRRAQRFSSRVPQ